MLSNEQIKARFAKARKAQQAGRLDEALKVYKKLLKDAPRLAEVHFNIGEILTSRNAVADAAKHFEAALKLKPAEPAIWMAYLKLAERYRNPKNLEILVKRSRPIVGHLPGHEFFSGLVAARKDDFEAAAPLLKSAIARGFAAPRAYVDYGAVLGKLERNDEALEQFDQALSLQPNNGFAHASKSELLRDMGRFEEALVSVRAAIERKSDTAPIYYTYSSIQKVQEGDPVIKKMEGLAKKSDLDDASKVFLFHALAKAMEDTQQHSKVFSYLKGANDALARAYPFDIAQDRKRVRELQSSYLELSHVGAPNQPVSSAAPIFVTGLPRSGTTLVEQILSAGSGVEGGGELGILNDFLNKAWQGERSNGDLTKVFEGLSDAGQQYAAEVTKRFPAAQRVTDKSISTYTRIGFIKWAMPNAKIVVVRRDPNDNALSIYKNMFTPGLHRYATKLEWTAQFMRLFEEQLDFWKTHCPDDFVEVEYEKLIADREAQIRALVDAVGLEWEDRFLESHKNKRKVATLSVAQVRQPIYASSVQSWKRYAVELAPFLNEYARLEPK